MTNERKDIEITANDVLRFSEAERNAQQKIWASLASLVHEYGSSSHTFDLVEGLLTAAGYCVGSCGSGTEAKELLSGIFSRCAIPPLEMDEPSGLAGEELAGEFLKTQPQPDVQSSEFLASYPRTFEAKVLDAG